MTGYNILLDNEGNAQATFIHNGALVTVTDDNPTYGRIVQALLAGETPEAFSLIDAARSITDRLVVLDLPTGLELMFDGQLVDNRLANTITRYWAEGRHTDNLVSFMERLNENPSERSREALFDWVADRNLVIDPDGYVLAFKGVDGELRSIHSGYGEVHRPGAEEPEVIESGKLPNDEGVVVTMPREMVNDNPDQGCSYGLHVGTWDYASSFGGHGVTLEVRVDPADVVSVPNDCGFQKMRTCRYEVIAIHDNRGDLSHYEPEATATEETFDELERQGVEPSFLARLRAKFSRSKS